MRVGVILDSCIGAHVHVSTAQQIGWRTGQYVQIDDDERGTRIVRRIHVISGADGMKPEYIYLDGQSMHYLDSEPHREVRVIPSEFDMDVP